MLDLKESFLEDRSSSGVVVPNVLPFDPNHGFDYDLVVIGGGSGGLACSKEARKYVSKVSLCVCVCVCVCVGGNYLFIYLFIIFIYLFN